MTTLTQDIGAKESRGKTAISELLVKANRESGRSVFSLGLDYLKLHRGTGKLRFYEYLMYGLHLRDQWTDEERARFISAHRHWPISNACNNVNWWAVTEDKWLSAAFLAQNGVAIPKNAAVFDPGPRLYPDVPKLQTAEDIAAFFNEQAVYPLFAKPMTGMWSAGAIRISGTTGTHLLMDGKEPVSFANFRTEVLGDRPYLIQQCLTPHGFFDGLTQATATVRSLNLVHDGALSVPYCMLKLPQRGNIADNLWRTGNVLCNLDGETGEILNIVTIRDGRRVTLDALPDSDRKLIGERLPDWEALRELNARTALLHAENHYGSTDIGLTGDGPVVVEVNTGCAFELMQLATGKGLLTDDMLAFFQAHRAPV